MKACAACGRLYPNDAGFCPVDGSALASVSQVPKPTSSDDPRVGQVVCERYEIRRVVADGGMGRVYEALDLMERRHVAVKVLHGEVARDPVQVERFKREFEVSKMLPHHHIVEVLEFAQTTDGSYLLVMEYLYGEELRGTLDREKSIAPARIVRMLSQVAIGLDEAHAKKFVHRDLKPDNIFLCQTPDGDIVKLLDFGSVKDKGESAKKLTVMGTTIGSPYYMAPEQAQGLDTLDHRADVWALGAIVYEALSGQVPFKGLNGPQILLEILTKEAKPVSEVAKAHEIEVPATLDPVLEKAFKKAAALRFESVGQLADAVGHAFKLTGSHLDWANLPQAELQHLISEQMAELLLAPKQVAKRTELDGFFGESDALGEQDLSLGANQSRGSERAARIEVDPMAQAMKAAARPASEFDGPLVLPTTGAKVPLPALLLVGLLLVSLLAYFLL